MLFINNKYFYRALSIKKKWAIFIENISSICLKCEKIVSIVVNDSSPEGIIPMDGNIMVINIIINKTC